MSVALIAFTVLAALFAFFSFKSEEPMATPIRGILWAGTVAFALVAVSITPLAWIGAVLAGVAAFRESLRGSERRGPLVLWVTTLVSSLAALSIAPAAVFVAVPVLAFAIFASVRSRRTVAA